MSIDYKYYEKINIYKQILQIISTNFRCDFINVCLN